MIGDALVAQSGKHLTPCLSSDLGSPGCEFKPCVGSTLGMEPTFKKKKN